MGGVGAAEFGRPDVAATYVEHGSPLRSFHLLTWPGILGTAAVITGAVFVAADASVRTLPLLGVGRGALEAIVSLYSAAALIVAGLVLVLVGAERAFTRLVRPRGPVLAQVFSALWYSAWTGLAAWQVAIPTFSGARIRNTHYAAWGPYAIVAVLCAAALGVLWLSARALRHVDEQRYKLPVAVATVFAVVAVVVIRADLTLFVGLYASLHVLLEVVAAVLLVAVFTILLRISAATRPRTTACLAWGVTAAAGLGAGHGLIEESSRARIDDELTFAWQEEVYVGRMLRRLAIAEAYAEYGAATKGVEMARIESLRVRYNLIEAGRSPRWDEAWHEPAGLADAARALRGPRRPMNVLVYYVDTLRADTATDPEVMPNVTGFAADNVSFPNAYSSGSDTIRALPGLNGGNYDFSVAHGSGLLDLAQAAGMKRMLAISDSAAAFLKTHLPQFRFDETLTVADHAPSKKVWGYGADQPTASALADTTVEWLESNPGAPFFVWVFNYDQHAWQELHEGYLKQQAQRLGLGTQDVPGQQPWRYRIVARLLDEQFGRLLGELDRLGLSDDTIVLFVSDHGESLGREGFMVHSVFLWEELIRVPLALKVPGLGPHLVEERVSVVDVAPTLARYLLDDPPLDSYHGEDLITYLVPDRPLRRHPLVMGATSKLTISRVGLIDETGRWKIVVPFESAIPELYDLMSPASDTVSVAKEFPEVATALLSMVVGTPLFPRQPDDFQAYTFH